MMMIPHSRPEITQADIDAVVGALKNRHVSQGPEVAKLEKALAAMFANAEAVVVSSGTAALYLALASLGVKEGDKVVMPSYTCNSLFSAISFTRAAAVCADVAEQSVNIDQSTVEAVLDRSVKAVIAPHTCGYLAGIEAISELGCPVIEDCAQAIGGKHPDGSPVGSKGIVSVFSFYATKLVPGGEGGACITADHELAERIRKLRDCDKQTPDARAFNFKMSDISAALATMKLNKLDGTIRQREAIVQVYDRAFRERSFRIKSTRAQAVCFRYLVDTGKSGDEFLRCSREAGIVCERPVWRPLHCTIGGKCPRTENIFEKLVSIPLYPGLTDDERTVICATLPELLTGP